MTRSAIRVGLLTVALAARARAGESATLRAADSGVSPEFCPTLRALLDAAPGGFASVRGTSRTGGENTSEGTKRFASDNECTVFGGTPPAYVCTLYAGDVEENADGSYDRAVSGVKDCLSASWKTAEKVDGVHTRTTTADGGSGPRVRVVSRDVSGDAYVVELWIDAGPASGGKGNR